MIRRTALAAFLVVSSGLVFAQGSSQLAPEVYKQRVRTVMEIDGIVVTTPVMDVAGRNVEATRRVAELIEEAIGNLPSDFGPAFQFWVHVLPPDRGRCPTRGMADDFDDQPFMQIFYDPAWTDATLRRIVHHEVGHIYHFSQGFTLSEDGGTLVGDQLLGEGLATWLARSAWLADLGFPSLEDAVLAYLDSDRQRSLVDDYELNLLTMTGRGQVCIDERDAIYTQRAAFVQFLIDEFGFGAVLEASLQEREILDGSDSNFAVVPLDYEAAFGESLGELERRWLGSLAAPWKPPSEPRIN